MGSILWSLVLIPALFGSGRFALAQEIIYPSGYSISSSYELSSTDFSIRDTLLVTWTVANNEGFDLTNMYLAENLPIEFTILTYSVQISGSPVSHFFSGPISGEVAPSFNAYRWAIDLPAQGDSLNRPLSPGETLILRYAAVCSTDGEYFLPFHTLCCYGNNTGIFSTADTIFVTVSPGSGIVEDSQTPPEKAFISFAYPDPFNGEVNIRFDFGSEMEGSIELKIYDLSGREVFRDRFPGMKSVGLIRWRPKINVASGLYFYRLIYGHDVSVGKMTLLK
jgi:hypothetical protein